jgi:hypothetical protein
MLKRTIFFSRGLGLKIQTLFGILIEKKILRVTELPAFATVPLVL